MWHYFKQELLCKRQYSYTSRAGDPGSIPGPGENFSLKLLKKRLLKVHREQCQAQIFLSEITNRHRECKSLMSILVY